MNIPALFQSPSLLFLTSNMEAIIWKIFSKIIHERLIDSHETQSLLFFKKPLGHSVPLYELQLNPSINIQV